MEKHRTDRVRLRRKHLRDGKIMNVAQHLAARPQDGPGHACLDEVLAVHAFDELHAQLVAGVDVHQRGHG